MLLGAVIYTILYYIIFLRDVAAILTTLAPELNAHRYLQRLESKWELHNFIALFYVCQIAG